MFPLTPQGHHRVPRSPANPSTSRPRPTATTAVRSPISPGRKTTRPTHLKKQVGG
jgi:hypothetical protein